jgi:hypothetical protein
MRSRLFLAAATLIGVVSCPAFAWNSLGHKVVAEIAWQQLEPEQRQKIIDLLRRHPRFDTDFAAKMEDASQSGDKATQDHWIFQHAATWPDVIRKNKDFDRPTWHYIDLPIYLNDSDQKAFAGRLPVNISADYPTKLRNEQYNVLQAFAYCKATLRSNAAPGVKAIACCWLFHLVGDMHQPLHSTGLFSVEHFPKGDEGGNKIPLVRGKNLHSLWDGLLGTQYYMRNVEKAVKELHENETYKTAWESAAKEMDPRKWIEESHDQCISFVYADVILDAVRAAPAGAEIPKIVLPEDYYSTAGEIARERIIRAGVRLGELLKGSK